MATEGRPDNIQEKIPFKRDKGHVIKVLESCRSAAAVLTLGQQVGAFHRRSVRKYNRVIKKKKGY